MMEPVNKTIVVCTALNTFLSLSLEPVTLIFFDIAYVTRLPGAIAYVVYVLLVPDGT